MPIHSKKSESHSKKAVIHSKKREKRKKSEIFHSKKSEKEWKKSESEHEWTPLKNVLSSV